VGVYAKLVSIQGLTVAHALPRESYPKTNVFVLKDMLNRKSSTVFVLNISISNFSDK
jgi:hypothetical protein